MLVNIHQVLVGRVVVVVVVVVEEDNHFDLAVHQAVVADNQVVQVEFVPDSIVRIHQLAVHHSHHIPLAVVGVQLNFVEDIVQAYQFENHQLLVVHIIVVAVAAAVAVVVEIAIVVVVAVVDWVVVAAEDTLLVGLALEDVVLQFDKDDLVVVQLRL